MNDSTPPPLPPQPPHIVRTRKGMGCLSIGCLVVVLILVLVGAGAGAMYWLFNQGGQAYLSEQPISVRVANATDEQYQAVLGKLAPFGQAMNDGHAATLEITPDELDVLIARSPQFESLRGHLFLTDDHNQLVADVSTPLTDSDTNHAYFNGRATLDASYSGNGFVVFVRHLTPLDPAQRETRFTHFLNHPAILNTFNQQMSASLNEGFREQADKDPATADFLHNLRTIIVQDGKIIITINERPGGAPDATPAPTSTPIATGDNQT